MFPAPAAVTAWLPQPVPQPTEGDLLGQRLEKLLEVSLRGRGASLASRLLPAPSFQPPGGQLADDGFSWLAFPAWLASSLGVDQTAEGRALVADLCWLQYCVYAAFRVQDDLVDGETDDRTLAVATNPLLVEAARCSARHFDGASPFWEALHEGIAATTSAILEIRRIQRSTNRCRETETRLYAELSASLWIASAGVLIAADRQELWTRQLRPALEALAVATQIVDDLRDIREDLDAGCVNYAAWFLSHPVLAASAEAVEAVVASNLATSNRLELLLDRAADGMAIGLTSLDRALCPEIFDHLDEYRRGLPELGNRVRYSAGVVLSGSTQNR